MPALVLIAQRDIAEGEEIVYDYDSGRENMPFEVS